MTRAVQRGLQLLIQGVAVAHAALVQQADGGHVGQRLADAYVRGVEGCHSSPGVLTLPGYARRASHFQPVA